MKKLLVLFLFSVCSLMTYSQIQTINIGTVADDNTGDPLRTLAIKVNNNFSYHSGLFSMKANLAGPTFIGTVILPATTSIGTVSATEILNIDGSTSNIQAQLNNTTTLQSAGFVKGDTVTKLATKTDLLNIEGSGGGITGKIFTLKGITGVTQGIPGAGDSIIIHTNFIGKYVDFFRNGVLQRQQPNNTERNGYWFSSIEGKLVVRPVFAANENIEVWSTNTILHENLVPQGGPGGGGEPPATPLLERLIAYYPLDETIGIIANDVHGGDNNGTHNGVTIPVTGILGYAASYNGDLNNTTIPYSAELTPADSMAVSLWIKVSTLPSVKGHVGYVYVQRNYDTPYKSAAIFIDDVDNTIYGYFSNSVGTEYYMNYTTPVTVGPWYHISIVNRGNGKNCELWVNKVLRDTDTFTGTIFPADIYASLGNSFEGGNVGFCGVIDEVYISRGIDPTGIVTLYGDGTPPPYPFTP